MKNGAFGKLIRQIFTAVLVAGLLVTSCAAFRTRMQIRIGLSEEFAPYQFFDASGNLVGIHPELLMSLKNDSNDSISLEFFESEDACRKALTSGKIDAMLSSSLSQDAVYADWATEPLTTLKLCAISRSGMENDTEIVAFELGTVKYSYLSHLAVQSYVAVGSQAQILQELLTGRADVAVGLEDCLLYQLEQSGVSEEFTVLRSYLGEVSYQLIVHPGNTVMLRWLNDKAVNLRSAGTYDSIYSNWSSLWVQDTGDQQRLVMRKLWIALAIALATVLAFFAFSTFLKRRLAAMTRALHRTNEELQLHLSATQHAFAKQQRILDAAKLCMLVFDQNGCITMHNQPARLLAGTSLDGKNIMDIYPYCALLEGFFPPQAEPCSGAYEGTLRLETRLYKYSAHVLSRVEQDETYMLSVEDVTEEEAQKEKLFEAEKSTTINRVVAGVAHEIRNPLMTIRTFADMIKDEDCDADIRKAFGQVVPDEVDRINQLVDKFINYAKPGTSEKVLVDAADLIRECLYLTKPTAKKNVIGFEVQTQPQLFVRVSPAQVKQVIINIIINGIEAMERKAATCHPDQKLMMQIREESSQDEVSIVIRDEGLGMSPEDLKRCREPYYTTKPTGIGLGLALSNELVLQNGGRMELESVQGEYTRISLIFKKEQPHET